MEVKVYKEVKYVVHQKCEQPDCEGNLIFMGDNQIYVLRQQFTGLPVHVCDTCGKDIDMDTKYEYPMRVVALEEVDYTQSDEMTARAESEFKKIGKIQRYRVR